MPFELVLAVNKMDTVPRSIGHGALESTVRRRMRQGGLPSPRQVHLVSCMRSIGVTRLLDSMIDLVRSPRLLSVGPSCNFRDSTVFVPAALGAM